MTLPTSEPLTPNEGQNLPPARRRQRRRMLVPASTQGRAAYLAELARKLTPSYDFFLFALLCGIILGAAILFDSPALYILVALLAPFLAPVFGLALASAVGSVSFFFQALGGTLVSGLVVFLCGIGAGALRPVFGHNPLAQVSLHTVFTWPDALLLSLGILLGVYLLVRTQQRPLVAGIAVAYELLLPLGVAGFGLISKVPGLWPDGLIVFAVHLAWAVLFGTLLFFVFGLRPLTLFGYTLATSLVLIAIAGVIILSGFGTALVTRAALPPPAPTATATLTVTPRPSTTPQPPTLQPTATNTLIPSRTPTLTVSPQPTPLYARIHTPADWNGAVIRKDPSYDAPVVRSLINDTLVEVLGAPVEKNGIFWAHIKTSDGSEGWIVQDLLATATPAAGW